MTPQEALNLVAGIRGLLEQVVQAEIVLTAAQSIQETIGNLQRDRQAEEAHLAEAKAAILEMQRILDRARQAVSAEQVKVEFLNGRARDLETDHLARVAALREEILALTEQRDALRGPVLAGL